VRTQIVRTALEHPSWGCARVARRLAEEGSPVSPAAVQKVLVAKGLGTIGERCLELETRPGLTAEQRAAVTRRNPRFRHRGEVPDRPGIVAVDRAPLDTYAPGRGLELLVAVDLYSCHGWAGVTTDPRPEAAARWLAGTVVTECRVLAGRGRGVGVVAPARMALETGAPGEILARAGASVGRGPRDGRRRHGFVALLLDLLREGVLGLLPDEEWATAGLDRLRDELTGWVALYNSGCRVLGFPNLGLTPAERLQRCRQQGGEHRRRTAPAGDTTVRLVIAIAEPGTDQAHRRHNLPACVLEELRSRLHAGRWMEREGCKVAEVRERGRWLARSLTTMRRSGGSVADLAADLGVAPGQVLLVADDAGLPLGQVQLRPSGVAAPHKGLRDVLGTLGVTSPRLLLGVGPLERGEDVGRYVRERFPAEQEPRVARVVALAADAVEAILREGVQKALRRYNLARVG